MSSIGAAGGVALLALALAACGPAAPATGEPVRPGVARAHFEVRGTGTQLVPVTVLFPSDPDGRPVGGQHPALVFVQGGLVSETRYEWLAVELAAAGHVVALPRHPLQLAFFSIENGDAARQLLLAGPGLLDGHVDPARVSVAGHSLGAVVAGKLMVAGGFRAVVYLAGYPDTADVAALDQARARSFAVAGTADCSARLTDVRAALARLDPPPRTAELEGVTHYQFTDSDAEDVKAGCTSGVDLATAHQQVFAAVRSALEELP